jgi:succinyl-diaminopimelate desuccinylase
MIDQGIFKRLCRRIEEFRQDMIQLQTELTAIPALAPESGGDGEEFKARRLKECLRGWGFPSITELNAQDERTSCGSRPNLIVRAGNPDAYRTVWIMSHLDIVPPGEFALWRQDPYKAYVQDGKIFGRGTEDNQQDLVASIFAVRAVLEEGVTPPNRMGLAFIADEETASQYGISHILSHPLNPFRRTDIVVVPDSGNPEGSLIEIAEKSVFWLRFRTLGKQGHASRPGASVNAFLAASDLVVTLHRRLHERFNLSDPLFEPPQSTFQPTKKEANVPNVNTIPGEDVFYLDSRVLPAYPLEEVKDVVNDIIRDVERRYGVVVETKEVQRVQAPGATAQDAPVVLGLQEAIQEVYGVCACPRGIGAGTVAAYLRREGYPVAVWCKTENTAHQPNEYCLIDNMIGNAKVFAHLFLQEPLVASF